MVRWQEDDVDAACQSWAEQWVSAFARDPDRASRYIGPLGCTLGRVRELADGASSNTQAGRHWPEVFLGQGLLVAIALKAMSQSNQEIVFAHYVWRWYEAETYRRLSRPMKQVLVARRLGISLAEYYHRRDTAKACVRTVLFLDTKDIARARGLSVVCGQAV